MKRCPQCSRFEADNALAFCRVDGTALVITSADIDREAGTRVLGSVAAETATNELVEVNTNLSNVRQTGPTTRLDEPSKPERTLGMSRPKNRWVLFVSGFALLVITAAG